MRGLVFFLIFIGCNTMYSQDLLTNKYGQVLEVTIHKVYENCIQYYRFDDSINILFTKEKSTFTKIEFVDFVPSDRNIISQNVLRQSEENEDNFIVNSIDGYKFEELEKFLNPKSEAYYLFKKYNRRSLTAKIVGTSSLFVMASGGIVVLTSEETITLVSGLILGIVGGVVVKRTALVIEGRAYDIKNNAIKELSYSALYKQQFNTREQMSLQIGLVSSGLGVQISL